jgi:hypothetical protein
MEVWMRRQVITMIALACVYPAAAYSADEPEVVSLRDEQIDEVDAQPDPTASDERPSSEEGWGSAGVAPEQDSAPLLAPDWPERFTLDIAQMYVGFEGEYESRRVRSHRSDRRDTHQENRDLRLSELFGLVLDGSAYDPNFLSYQAGLEFGLTHTRFEEEIGPYEQTDSDTDWLNEYDVTVDMFRNKPISLHAYARRYDDRIPRRFLPSLREEQTEAGVNAVAVFGQTVTELGFSWEDIQRTGNSFLEDDETLETSRFYIDHKWDISEHQHLRLFYDHERQENTYQGSLYDFDTSRDEVRLEHDLALGSKKQHRLDTFFRFNTEDGDLARDELELVPRLTLQLTDELRTIHRYAFYRYEQDAIEVNLHKFDNTAVWTPNEDWRITVDGYGLYENIDGDVDTHEFGGSFDVGYDRDTSLGELFVNAAFGYDHSRTEGDAGRRFVRREAHQLSTVRPTYLREQGVIPGTIVGYNDNRSRIYVEGLDYVATVVRGRAFINRLPSGRIAEDEVVYFDYQYILPAHAVIHTYRGDFLVEHRFEFGLTPYYSFESRCQEVENSLAAPFFRDNQHRHRFGARYERNVWTVGAEYEIFDDTIEPYDAYHLTGRWDIINEPAHSLDFNSEVSWYDFDGGDIDERDVWWIDVELNDRMQINEFLSFNGGAAYRWEHDSIDGETNAVDVSAGLQYIRGLLTVELVVEYDLLDIVRNDDSGFALFLNVRRDLTHLVEDLEKLQ